MRRKLPVKIPDLVIISLSLSLTLFSGYQVFARSSDVARIVIQGPNNRSWVFPLDIEETVRVPGVLGGDTVVRISDGEVWAESSPCDNQLCVGMGRINADSWWVWVACLPNNVMFMIERGHGSGQTDAGSW